MNRFNITGLNSTHIDKLMEFYRYVRLDFPNLSEQSFYDVSIHNLRRSSAGGVYMDNALAGAVMWSPKLSRLSFLAVAPEWRGSGMGRMLVCAALKAMPGRPVYVETYAGARGRAARVLYTSMGFKESGRVKGYEEPVIMMILTQGNS